jgi:protein SCO1/2
MPPSFLQVEHNERILFAAASDGRGRGARFSVLERASARSDLPWAQAHGGTLKPAPRSNHQLSRTLRKLSGFGLQPAAPARPSGLPCAVWLAAVVLGLTGCARREALPTYGRVPAFALTSETGAPFDSQTLAGKIWVADFFFTTCLGPCPRMSARMNWVQKQVASLPDVRLVSFTVDPEHDTPPVLKAYAQRFRAQPGRWFLLTGSQTTLNTLDRNAFKMGNVDGSFVHSTLFALVDRHGQIRGYYHTEDGASLEPLIADIRRLTRERP